MDRESIRLLGLLPAPRLCSAPSRVPLLCARLNPCHGSGHKSPVRRSAPDEARDGDHSIDHMDIRHVFLGYHFLGVFSLLVFLWQMPLCHLLSLREEGESRWLKRLLVLLMKHGEVIIFSFCMLNFSKRPLLRPIILFCSLHKNTIYVSFYTYLTFQQN